MAPHASFIADNISMPSKLRSLVQAPKPEISIALRSRNKTYTTLDRIEGVVTITTPVEVSFDDVEIEFIGTARTCVERMTTASAAQGRSEAYHNFLKLVQPDLQQHLPDDWVLRPGQTYNLPFVFAIPQQLLPRVCQHPVCSDAVRDAHLRLPPTFGDKDLASMSDALDDVAPDMASIRYGVFAKISEIKFRADEPYRSTVAAKARRVRVIPAVEEQPPLDIHPEDGHYVLRKEKTIKKNMLSGKNGTLVMESSQPRSLKINSYNNPNSRISTMATVMLRFDPAHDKAQPPKLASLGSRIKIMTHFASTARRDFPSKSAPVLDLSQSMHSEQITLSSRCVANVEWTLHDTTKPSLEPIERRDSATSTSSLSSSTQIPEPSANFNGTTFYTARIVVPVSLPPNKAFPPTFYSCLISRTYTLKLDLSLASKNALTSPSVDLKLPVQISSEQLIGDEFARSGSVDFSLETDVDAPGGGTADASSFFRPRTIGVPNENFTQRSRIGSQAPVADEQPPGYSALTSGAAIAMPSRRTSSVVLLPHRALSVPVH